RMIGEAFLDSLVSLHGIEISAPGVQELGKPEGYVERQVRGWADRWERAKTEEVSELDGVVQWLSANIPAPLVPSLIHNDYKLDNIMLARGSPDRVEAVLDWEMATLGDPLSDFGLALCYWVWATAPEVRTAGIPALTSRAGWYGRDDLVERYGLLTGRDVTHIGYGGAHGGTPVTDHIRMPYSTFHRGKTQDDRKIEHAEHFAVTAV